MDKIKKLLKKISHDDKQRLLIIINKLINKTEISYKSEKIKQTEE